MFSWRVSNEVILEFTYYLLLKSTAHYHITWLWMIRFTITLYTCPSLIIHFINRCFLRRIFLNLSLNLQSKNYQSQQILISISSRFSQLWILICKLIWERLNEYMKFKFLRFNLLEKDSKMNHDINFAADLSSDVIQFTIDLIKIQTITNSKNNGL